MICRFCRKPVIMTEHAGLIHVARTPLAQGLCTVIDRSALPCPDSCARIDEHEHITASIHTYPIELEEPS